MSGYRKLYLTGPKSWSDLGSRRVGFMPGVHSSPWPISRRTPDVQAAGKKAIALSPIAIEVVRRIDALFDIERPINGKSAEERRTVRQELSRPLVDDLHVYLREQRAKLSPAHDLAKAIDYILKRWPAFTLFLTTDVYACRTMPPNVRYAA